ncbi:Uncharacterised protein [Campylobacter ureolyticus]|nr:Uncharacterised protein [Campylobacter ureolyticus]
MNVLFDYPEKFEKYPLKFLKYTKSKIKIL